MKGWLLDTNIVSELRKPHCHPAVKAWTEMQQPQSFYLSVVTVAEIRFGIERASKPSLQRELAQWLDEELRPWFSDRLLPIDENAILTWRKQVELGRKQGYTFSQPDLFIAATAANHELCVVTRNVKDFQKAGVAVFNPFLFQGGRA
ncbi:MAG: type II toxin-antitoxin system VapC family toxin [Cyanobacteria bacterium J06642_2]